MADDWEDEWSEPTGQPVCAGRGASSEPPVEDERPGRQNYSNGPRRRDDDGAGGGGFRGRRDNDDNQGSRGGGFRGRRENDDDGGGRSGGFRGRKDNDDDGGGRGGGFRNRRESDDNGGGFRGRRDDNDNGGGFRGRRDDNDNGGGFRGRRGDNDNGDGFRGRRENDEEGGRGGGFRGRRDTDEEGGGRGGRRDDTEEGGGGGRGRRRDADGENGETADGEEPRKAPVTYVPAERDIDELYSMGSSTGINFNRYSKIEVKVTGDNAPPPINSFKDAGFRDYVLENIEKCGYKTPTPVQRYTIPIVAGKRDLMASAQTGSGKTAAYMLPIINQILEDKDELVIDSTHVEPHCLVLVPTRELADQIRNEAVKFSRGSDCRVAVAYGGVAARHQANIIQRGCHVLVATTGRLLDFVNRGRITFSSLKYFVLDEGDRMLDMGFVPDVEKVLNHPTMVPKGTRQTLMFSATFPKEVQRMASSYMDNHLFITVGILGSANEDVLQNFFEVDGRKKRDKLMEILDQATEKDKFLVFVETKRNADFIACFLSQKKDKYSSTSIHGDREQQQREEAIYEFKTGKRKILVATAVAARGLDIPLVTHVINYDMPKSIDEYIHRIGRTGRVGNQGQSTTFIDIQQDKAIVDDLIQVLRDANQDVPQWLEDYGSGSMGTGGDNFGGQDFRGAENTSRHVLEKEEEEEW